MKLGKKVLGEEVFAKQKEADRLKQLRGAKLGKRVTGAKASPHPHDPNDTSKDEVLGLEEDLDEELDPEATAGEGSDTEPASRSEDEDDEDEETRPSKPTPPAAISLKDLEAALKANKSIETFDKLVEAELERPEGEPRRGAILLFQAAEKKREGGARPEVLAELARLAKNTK